MADEHPKLQLCADMRVTCSRETDCEHKRIGKPIECSLAFDGLVPAIDALNALESKIMTSMKFASEQAERSYGLPAADYYNACYATLKHIVNEVETLRKQREDTGEAAHPNRCETCSYKMPTEPESGMCNCSKLKRNISWQQWCILRDSGCASHSVIITKCEVKAECVDNDIGLTYHTE